jgi:hypothetical protein
MQDPEAASKVVRETPPCQSASSEVEWRDDSFIIRHPESRASSE